MPTVRCPNCNKKIDTSFYGSCLDCGTLLPIDGQTPQPVSPRVEPTPAPQPLSTAPDPMTDPQRPDEQTQTGGGGGSVLGRIGGGILGRLVFVGLFIGGSALWGIFTGADRGETGEIIDAGTLGAEELQVGDCLDWPFSGSDEIEVFDSVDARPCSEPHDMEVYSVLEYPSVSGTFYPGDDELTNWGFDQCFSRFEAYIGAPYEAVPDVDITIFWPSEEAWDQDDRTVHCLMIAYDEGDKLTGTLLNRDA